MTLEQYCQLPSDERDKVCYIIAQHSTSSFAEVQGWLDIVVERYMIYESWGIDQYTQKAREYINLYNQTEP